MLPLLDDEHALAEALEIARGLGAKPLTRRVAGRMRELGIRVSHGRRGLTRANPAGLTARRLEVLALLVDGLMNAEIAERLIVSPRTASTTWPPCQRSWAPRRGGMPPGGHPSSSCSLEPDRSWPRQCPARSGTPLARAGAGDALSVRQPVATHGNGFRLFEPFPRASDLLPVAAGCNHGAP